MKTQIVIAGGGYAGLFAAARLRKYSGMNVVLIDAHDHFVQRVRLHEYLAGGSMPKLAYRELLASHGLDFIQGRIQSIQPDQQTLILEAAEGARIVRYDWLLYGLGSRTKRWDHIPGLNEWAQTLDAGPQLDRTRQRLQELPAGESVVIMGAGLTGLEAATEIKEAHPHLAVTLVNAGRAFPGYAPGAEQEIRNVLRRLDIRLMEGRQVTRVEAARIHCDDGSSMPCAVAIHCMGLEVSSLARDAGIRTAANGQIQVDPYLRSLSHPNILAVGDAAELDAASCPAPRMSCAAACPMGTYAADTLHRLQSGQKLLPFRFGFTGRCVSLGRRAAVVQLVNALDQPRRWFFRGRLAVWIKEMICRGTVQVPQWELRWGLALNRWYQPKDI
ncbi:MAG TPA: FAD-dependent oxidoreductase [Oligoflexus sp.]|uniref:NAD(P)/FAD-dependent oxidoreductase n=1 Tax=Oligoflexus sp. TaxID=1971216 RepID=UPI002D268D15|nr:FAD-dependent oxidoreductase [Oligoflexus sp.]HYX31806.1 FAD-dependent oxidoreductase [Oligoflexus sp.]